MQDVGKVVARLIAKIWSMVFNPKSFAKELCAIVQKIEKIDILGIGRLNATFGIYTNRIELHRDAPSCIESHRRICNPIHFQDRA